MERPGNIIDLKAVADQHQDNYYNTVLSHVNDHVLRLSVMTEPYYWHFHPDSDETFIGVEGILLIALEARTIELAPGQTFTVPRNTRHCTRPKTGRSVNLTFEHKDMVTVKG